MNEWTPKYTDSVTKILLAKYKYGFKVGSIIEIMKLRNHAETMKLELPKADKELEKELIAAGSLIDGKVYVFDDEFINELGDKIDRIFRMGTGVIFLSAFIERNEEWLEENHIISESLLKKVLKQCRPSLYFGQNMITLGERMTEQNAVLSEIRRVAGNEAVVYTENLCEQLTYIPSKKILRSLSVSDEFVWIKKGKYFLLNHFIYSDKDAENILSFVSSECDHKGYASITEIPIENIAEENFELSITALYNAVYHAVLKGKYYLNGKILTASKNGTDITILLEEYCQYRNECTVTEMMERAKELTGSSNKQYSILALYNKMVRADVNRFVSEKMVDFDIDKIDDLLAEIIGERFAPIRKISTFALFPACGITWNHYLLESYCYRFSRKYRLSVLKYNDKNAGIIAATDLQLTHKEMLSEAVAKADIELTPEAVGEYLFMNGFTAKRKYTNMPEIIELAKNIREEE